MESNASLSKSATALKPKYRTSVTPSSPLVRTKKYFQSAYDLNSIPRKLKGKYTNTSSDNNQVQNQYRSSSLQNLEHDGLRFVCKI